SGEQDFYASRGYSEPSRCPDCRAARKAERDSGGYGSYGGGGGSRGPREMFTATCSSCGQEAQVPFQPSGDKPVYCSACFHLRGRLGKIERASPIGEAHFWWAPDFEFSFGQAASASTRVRLRPLRKNGAALRKMATFWWNRASPIWTG